MNTVTAPGIAGIYSDAALERLLSDSAEPAPTPQPEVKLTEGQELAYSQFVNFLFDPDQEAFVIKGYAGTGKSTLVRTLVKELPQLIKANDLIENKESNWNVVLTATTNKACEALNKATGFPVDTVHSFLKLRVSKDYDTQKTKLVSGLKESVKDTILIVDEASYIDEELLGYIFNSCHGCKIVFIGDPAQLTPVRKSYAPVFAAGFPTAELTEVMRQADQNQIQTIATGFRNAVNGEGFPKFVPNQSEVIHLSRSDFEGEILKEFRRSDWKYSDSKVLAWTNKAVIQYNHWIREHVQGEPHIQDGDYAVNNNYMGFKKGKIKTDELVHVTNIRSGYEYGTPGSHMLIDDRFSVFMPESLAHRKAAIAKYRGDKDFRAVEDMERTWIDLRAAYSCTINKSQGSTFDRVFIDLDDIARCNSGNQIARMLYVGVSRARYQVFLVGDVV